MYKSLADLFAPTETQITSQALNTIKWSSVFAMPLGPVWAVHYYDIDFGSTIVNGIYISISIVSFIALLVTSSSRIFNRVWIVDKYLDESEIARKRESSTFAFTILYWVGVILLLIIALWFASGYPAPKFTQLPHFWGIFVANLVYFALLFQAFKLAQITPADDDFDIDDYADENLAKDKRYNRVLMMFICTLAVLVCGCVIADAIYDDNSSKRAIAKCGPSNVASISTDGFFKTVTTCKTPKEQN